MNVAMKIEVSLLIFGLMVTVIGLIDEASGPKPPRRRKAFYGLCALLAITSAFALPITWIWS